MKYLIGIAGLALVIIFFTSYLGVNNTNNDTNTQVDLTAQGTDNTDTTTTQTNEGITLTELLTHNTKTDCWVGFKGKAYDITTWLDRHPGGVNAILRHCGTAKEFEDAFTKKHGDSKVTLFMQVGVYMGDVSSQGALE